MKKVSCKKILLLAVVIIPIIVILSKGEESLHTLVVPQDAFEKIQVEIDSTDVPYPNVLLGIGVEFDPLFYSVNVSMNNGAKASDWNEIICPRVSSMRIQRFRVGVFPEWWEPYNDNDDPDRLNEFGFSWDNRDMQSLYNVLDLAENVGADVNMVLWGCPRSAALNLGNMKAKYLGRHFLSDGRNNWITGPADPKEFAENITALLRHLIIEKGYTCVKEITPFNEPDGNVLSFDKYVECVMSLDRVLKKYSLRERIRIVVSDNIGNNTRFLQKCADKLSAEADLFCSHTYSFGYKSKNSEIADWELNNLNIVSSTRKVHFVGEFGSNEVVGATRQKDIDKYERGILLCRQAIEYLNAGAVSVSYWTLFDHYRDINSSYKDMQQLGLWRYVNKAYEEESYYTSSTEDYYPRPQYYAYSLLTRFIRKGDIVYPLSLNKEFVSGTALLHEDGTWSYVFANAMLKSYALTLHNAYYNKKKFDIYVYKENILPEHANQIKKTKSIKSKKGLIQLNLSPNSVTVVSQYMN